MPSPDMESAVLDPAEAIKAALLARAARDPSTPPETLRALAGSEDWLVRQYVAMNRSTPTDVLLCLEQDGEKLVRFRSRQSLKQRGRPWGLKDWLGVRTVNGHTKVLGRYLSTWALALLVLAAVFAWEVSHTETCRDVCGAQGMTFFWARGGDSLSLCGCVDRQHSLKFLEIP